MLRIAENTNTKRAELRDTDYRYVVSNANPLELILINVSNVTVGTEKQINYAKSLLHDKLIKVNRTTGLMISNGAMDKATYIAGMESLVKELESYNDAKFIIERVR